LLSSYGLRYLGFRWTLHSWLFRQFVD